ncbi:MAG: DUF11 domain-containing protein [Bacteroidota bacterium]|nr:DUF11 domain-containing protein [Bacteroidota bacterium]
MKPKIAVLAALLIMLTAFISVTAFAGGTPYGTVITNTATMNYKDSSGTSFSPITATVSVTVEKVPGLSLAVTPQSQTVSDSMYVTYAFHITNTGNAKDTISLTTSTNTQGWAVSYYKDADSNGVLSQSEISAGAITTLYGVGEDTTVYVIMRFLAPKGTHSQTVDIDTVTAQTSTNWPGSVGTATAKGAFTTTVSRSIFTLTKTTGNSTPPPDQNFTYTINYADTGKGTGKSVSISDTLNNNLTYVSSTNSGSASGQVVTWSIGTVSGGGSGSVQVTVKVKAGISSGTVIANHAYVAFTDSISNQPRDTTSVPVNVTVSSSGAWTVSVRGVYPNATSFSTNHAQDSTDVSQAIKYEIRLTNTGNATDTVTLSRTSSNLPWKLYWDPDSSASINGSNDTLVASGAVIKGIKQDSSVYFFADTTVAHGVADRSLDTTTYTFTSVSSSASGSGYHVTRVKAPVMALQKWVTKVNSGRSRPGDTLMYTIKYVNSGSGNASNIVITDASPTNTSYVTSSVAMSSDSTTWTPKTDASDGDEVTVSSGSITVNVGTVSGAVVSSSYYGYIRFKVKIQ